MVKCPNCGSTAQLKPIDRQIKGSVYYPTLETTYKCGCGRMFVTLASICEDDEMIVDPNV